MYLFIYLFCQHINFKKLQMLCEYFWINKYSQMPTQFYLTHKFWRYLILLICPKD